MIGLLMMASGHFLTGNMLYQYCKDGDAHSDCVGYVSGVLDTVIFFQGNDPHPIVCMPDGVTRGQAADIVEKYLRQNPEIRQRSASVLATTALSAAYPCAKGG